MSSRPSPDRAPSTRACAARNSGANKARARVPAVLAYYLRIAPVLLPHVRGRALTLGRYP